MLAEPGLCVVLEVRFDAGPERGHNGVVIALERGGNLGTLGRRLCGGEGSRCALARLGCIEPGGERPRDCKRAQSPGKRLGSACPWSNLGQQRAHVGKLALWIGVHPLAS